MNANNKAPSGSGSDQSRAKSLKVNNNKHAPSVFLVGGMVVIPLDTHTAPGIGGYWQNVVMAPSVAKAPRATGQARGCTCVTWPVAT